MDAATDHTSPMRKNLNLFQRNILGAQSLRAKSMSGLCLSPVEPQKETTARSAFLISDYLD
jgi:hypothetical protein